MTAPRLGPAPSALADRLPAPPAAWAYMVRCADGSLYSGWTNDLARRLHAHKTGRGGAKYTHGHGAVKLAYAERCADRSAALRREAALKKLDKAAKEALAVAWQRDHAVTLRPAALSDAPAVNALYGWYVTHSTATFQYKVPTLEEQRASMAAAMAAAPFFVAQDASGRLCGYACAHPWHTREAYAWDAELTIYCDPDCVGQGVGAKLYGALIPALREQGYCNAVALVAHPNPESEAFHRAMGFRKVGTEPRTGYKFGTWLDLQYWWLDLRPGNDAPAPVRLPGRPQE